MVIVNHELSGDADFCLSGGGVFTVLNIPTLLLSTSDVYKGTNCSKKIEEGEPYSLHPFADFTASVLPFIAAESYYLNNSKCMCIRTFPVFGEGTPDNILNRLVDRVVAGEPLESPILGYRVRSWLYITDFLVGFDLLLKEFLHGTTGIYNLGSDYKVRVQELYSTVWQLAGLNIDAAVDERYEDMPWRPNSIIPDLTRTKAVTGWRPTTSLRSGIAEMLTKRLK